MDAKEKISMDSLIAFILIKRLLSSVDKSKAYRLGLVDSNGKTIRKPETEEEKSALTPLDKTVFKMKRMIGPRLTQAFNNFFYVTTMGTDLYSRLTTRGSVEQRSELLRLQKDMEKLTEKYNCQLDDMLITMLHEDIREGRYE